MTPVMGFMKSGSVAMKKLQDLALAIDSASDAGDEEALRQFGKECEESLDGPKGKTVYSFSITRPIPMVR